jgi:hypothetical protein
MHVIYPIQSSRFCPAAHLMMRDYLATALAEFHDTNKGFGRQAVRSGPYSPTGPQMFSVNNSEGFFSFRNINIST